MDIDKKLKITLTQEEIIEACREYAFKYMSDDDRMTLPDFKESYFSYETATDESEYDTEVGSFTIVWEES